MTFVYVIECSADQTRYTGIAFDPVKRLKENNSGKNRFTKGHRPWKIIYPESQYDWVAVGEIPGRMDILTLSLSGVGQSLSRYKRDGQLQPQQQQEIFRYITGY